MTEEDFSCEGCVFWNKKAGNLCELPEAHELTIKQRTGRRGCEMKQLHVSEGK